MAQPQSWLRDLCSHIETDFATLLHTVLNSASPSIELKRYGPALQEALQRLNDRLDRDRLTIAEAREAQRVAEARLLALQNRPPAPVPLPDPVVGMQVRYDGREVEVMLAGPRFVAFTDRTCCLRHEWTPDRVEFITDSDAEATDDPDSEPLS